MNTMTINMNPEITVSIIAILVTAIFGYFGIYLPYKFRKEDRAPRISISPFQDGNYFHITNHGGDILDLKIKITWLQDKQTYERDLDDFFHANEDPRFGTSHKSNTLKRGETKKVVSCPLYSDDGLVKISISGTDINGKEYKKNLTLQNKVKDKK